MFDENNQVKRTEDGWESSIMAEIDDRIYDVGQGITAIHALETIKEIMRADSDQILEWSGADAAHGVNEDITVRQDRDFLITETLAGRFKI